MEVEEELKSSMIIFGIGQVEGQTFEEARFSSFLRDVPRVS